MAILSNERQGGVRKLPSSAVEERRTASAFPSRRFCRLHDNGGLGNCGEMLLSLTMAHHAEAEEREQCHADEGDGGGFGDIIGVHR